MYYNPAKIYIIVNLIAVIIAMPSLSVASNIIAKRQNDRIIEVLVQPGDGILQKKLSNHKHKSKNVQRKKMEIIKHETAFLEYYDINKKAKLLISKNNNLDVYRMKLGRKNKFLINTIELSSSLVTKSKAL